MTDLLSWVDSGGQAWCVELMSIYVYNLVTDTFIIVCYHKKERDKEDEGERDGRLIPSWKKILFYFIFYMKCTLLLLWDAASNPGTDFIIHHLVPHDRQLFLPESEPGSLMLGYCHPWPGCGWELISQGIGCTQHFLNTIRFSAHLRNCLLVVLCQRFLWYPLHPGTPAQGVTASWPIYASLFTWQCAFNFALPVYSPH